MKKTLMWTITVLFLITIYSCGKEKCPTKPSSDPSLASDIQPIFTAKCAIASCHDTFAQAGLDLTKDKAYDNLVDVPSTNDPSKIRVVRNNANSSYLFIKIAEQPADGTARMPIGGNPLPDNEIQLIQNWIDQGAKNN
ncbi:MAG: hypothetical protein JSW07_20550 [bacterium]|nr:MAG: hypothetical protein JSW07_20550 [bacterium]